MSRLTRFLLLASATLCAFASATAFAQNPTLNVGTGSGVPGGTATVSLTFTNGTPDAADIAYDLTFDNTVLTPVQGATGNTGDASTNPVQDCLISIPASHQGFLSGCNDNTGSIRVAVTSAAGGVSLPTGDIGTVTFSIDGAAMAGTYDITATPISGNDTAGNPIDAASLSAVNGSVTVAADQCALSVTTPATLPLTFNLASLTETQDVVFTNTSVGVACTSPTVSIAGGSYTQTNTCTTDIAAGGTCTVSVSNNGSIAGDTGTVTLATTEATAEAAIETVDMMAGACTLTATPTTVSFVDPANPMATQVTITNTDTTADCDPFSVALDDTTNYELQNNTCGATLAADSNCMVDVNYIGAATGDADGGTLTATSGQASASVALSTGAVTEPADISVMPTSLLLAMTGDMDTVMVSNPGGEELTGLAFTLADTTNFAIDAATTCGATLAAGASCDIVVSYTGADPATTTLDIASAAGNVTVNVIGGQAPIAIPTISQWSMMIVASLLAMVAAFGFRRKQS